MVTINNAVNNTVGASNSGATNTLTVTNPSNTASSKSLVNVTVGGSTADDAFTTYTVSGVTNWSQGIDNSVVGDPFVLAASTALGTTNVMSANTAGAINYPLQPCFYASLSAQDNNVTGDGTTFVLGSGNVFTINNDQSSSFVNTGTFTVPKNGTYMFFVRATVSGTVAATDALLQIVTGGSALNVDRGLIPDLTGNVLQGSGLVTLAASVAVTFQLTVSGTTKTVNVMSVNGGTQVFGFLVC